MKYAHIDQTTNKLLGWYDDEVHGTFTKAVYETKVIQKEEKDENGKIIKPLETKQVLVKEAYFNIANIPTPNIKVSDDVWEKAIDINANCYENGNFVIKDFRTKEEIAQNKIVEAQIYLNNTDWVEPYLIKHYMNIEPLPEDSNKLIIEQKRKEARSLL